MTLSYSRVAQSDLLTPPPGSLRISPQPQMEGGRLREGRERIPMEFDKWKPNQNIAKINPNRPKIESKSVECMEIRPGGSLVMIAPQQPYCTRPRPDRARPIPDPYQNPYRTPTRPMPEPLQSYCTERSTHTGARVPADLAQAPDGAGKVGGGSGDGFYPLLHKETYLKHSQNQPKSEPKVGSKSVELHGNQAWRIASNDHFTAALL